MVKRVLEEVIKYRKQRLNKPIVMKLDVDLTGWKYGDQDLIQKWMMHENNNNHQLLETLKQNPNAKAVVPELMGYIEADIANPPRPSIKLQIVPHCTNNPGAWQPMLETLMICADPNVGEFLQTAINHELTHFAQSFLSYAMTGQRTKDTVGLPSKKIRTPEFQQNWNNGDDWWKQQRAWHLDDNEFYTILQDRKTEIIQGIQQQKLDYAGRLNYFKNYIAREKFFISMRSNPAAAGKYQKAVSELWKAMESVPLPKMASAHGLWKLAATPQDIAATLQREFPNAPPASVQEISGKTNNVFMARWLLRNVMSGQIPSIDEALGHLKTFEASKQRLKSNNLPVDLSQYDYKNLVQTVGQIATLQRSKSQQKQDMPKAVIDMITAISTKGIKALAPQLQQSAKAEIFNWISMIWNRRIENGVKAQVEIERSGVGDVMNGSVFRQPGEWPGEAKIREHVIQKELPFFIEDQNEYTRLIQEFYLWKYSPEKAEVTSIDDIQNLRAKDYPKATTTLSSFKGKNGLSTFLDQVLTPDQKAQKYTLDPAASEGLEIIAEGDLQAIKVTEWNENFAQNLCNAANWCVRDKRAFDNYNIGPSNPLFLISKGGRQMALIGIQSGQIKDVNDNEIDADMGLLLFPIISKLADQYNGGVIPTKNDFQVLTRSPQIREEMTRRLIAKPIKSLFWLNSELKDIDDGASNPAEDGVPWGDETEASYEEWQTQRAVPKNISVLIRERGVEFNARRVAILTAKKDEILALIFKSKDAPRNGDLFKLRDEWLMEMIKYGIVPPEMEFKFLEDSMKSTRKWEDSVYAGKGLLNAGKLTKEQFIDQITSIWKNWVEYADSGAYTGTSGGVMWLNEDTAITAIGSIPFLFTPTQKILVTDQEYRTAINGQNLPALLQSIMARTQNPALVNASAWVKNHCKFAAK